MNSFRPFPPDAAPAGTPDSGIQSSNGKDRNPDEREHHFGIVHADFSPKPAFSAYKTLTSMCPSGSTAPAISTHGKVYLANWPRPDNVKVWAVWTAESVQKISLRLTGKAQALNHLGETQSVPAGEYAASPSLLYLIGPEKVEVH